MKGKVLRIALIVVLLVAALFVNPMDLYRKFTAEQEMNSLIVNYLHLHKDEEVKDVRYLGGNVYLLETDATTYLVKLERKGISGDDLEIYIHEASVKRMSQE